MCARAGERGAALLRNVARWWVMMTRGQWCSDILPGDVSGIEPGRWKDWWRAFSGVEVEPRLSPITTSLASKLGYPDSFLDQRGQKIKSG